jgi:hypothetical protein
MTDLPPHPDTTDEDRYVHGTYAEQSVITLDQVGTLTKTHTECSFMIDTQTQQLVQVGGEGELDVSKIDVIAQMLQIDPATFWPDLTQGDSAP